MPSNGGSTGRPGGSDSPTGRMPHERSRDPIQVAGSTTRSSPSMTSDPSQEPSWANRWASSVGRSPPARIRCGCSWTTGNSPRQRRSMAIPSVSSRTIRSSCSGSTTSSR